MIKKYTYLLCLLLISNVSLKAEHLLGGKFSYKKIDANNIEFKLELERDCAGGGALFETALRIGLYSNTTNQRLSVLSFTNIAIVKSPITFDCEGAARCVEVGVYTKVMNTSNIPPSNNGYYLQWERCCMNINNLNLFDPTGTPYAAVVELPSNIMDSSLVSYNSPQTTKVFNPLICVNKEFSYKVNYTDADGDSISYRFIQPITGGYTSLSFPGQNTGPKPYDLLEYTLGYDKYNFIDAVDTPTLNPRTGELKFTPTQIGSYVFGYAVDEFRNGSLIGTVYHQSVLTTIVCNSVILIQPEDQFVNLNERAVFKVKHAQANVSYQWQVSENGLGFVNIPSETSDSLVISNVVSSMYLNKYRCAINKGTCNDYSYEASLKSLNVGINTKNNLSLTLFPNPSNSIVNLQGGEYISIEIYSLEGKLLLRSDLNNSINISPLENGIYLVNAKDYNGQTYFAKVLKSTE